MDILMLLGAAGDPICETAKSPLRFIGIIVTAFKVIIPIIIIIIGIFDLATAAISSKPEEVKKKATGLLWRLVGGVVIFFLPSLILAFMGMVAEFNKGKMGEIGWETCRTCLLEPWNCSKPAE